MNRDYTRVPVWPTGTNRRQPQNTTLRQAITMLRLAEFRAADNLPTHDMRELTRAIDLVVWQVRTLLEGQP